MKNSKTDLPACLPRKWKKCRYCGRRFMPDARVGKRQKRCFLEECRCAENCRKARKWIAGHPKEKAERKVKARAWAYAYPHYWRHYRKAHPEYVRRDNARRAEALRKSRCSAKLTSMRDMAVEKLRKIQTLRPEGCSAKLTERDRWVEGIMDYLFWTVKEDCPQNITPMDFDRPPV